MELQLVVENEAGNVFAGRSREGFGTPEDVALVGIVKDLSDAHSPDSVFSDCWGHETVELKEHRQFESSFDGRELGSGVGLRGFHVFLHGGH